MRIFQRLILFLISLLLLSTACQRFESPPEQTGLDKDSHSYSYVGYSDQRMKQSLQTIQGVKRVTTDYNGRRIIVRVYVSVPSNQYGRMKRAVKDRLNQVTPLNPVHVIIHPFKDKREQP